MLLKLLLLKLVFSVGFASEVWKERLSIREEVVLGSM